MTAPDDAQRFEQSAGQVETALSRLSANDREAITLIAWDGLQPGRGCGRPRPIRGRVSRPAYDVLVEEFPEVTVHMIDGPVPTPGEPSVVGHWHVPHPLPDLDERLAEAIIQLNPGTSVEDARALVEHLRSDQ